MRKGLRGGEQPINGKDSLWEQKNKDKENKNGFWELATKHDCQKISLSDSKCFLRRVGRTQRTNGHEWTGGQMSAAQHSSMILAHLEKEIPHWMTSPGHEGGKGTRHGESCRAVTGPLWFSSESLAPRQYLQGGGCAEALEPLATTFPFS